MAIPYLATPFAYRADDELAACGVVVVVIAL
jgi:hypothetical protein